MTTLTVTPGVLGRADVDCTCGWTARRASTHAANLAAIAHHDACCQIHDPARCPTCDLIQNRSPR